MNNNMRICVTMCVFALVLAFAVQASEAGRVDWRNNPQVRDYLKNRPMARRATEGPLGGIIDLILDIIFILLDMILGGALAPLKSQVADLQEQIKTMTGKN